MAHGTKLVMDHKVNQVRPSSMPPPAVPIRRQVKQGLEVQQGKFHHYRGMVLLLLAALVVWLNFGFIKPLFMGAIFAIVLYPLMGLLERWRVGSSAKALLITLLFTVSFLIPIGIMVYLGANAALKQLQTLSNLEIGSTDISGDSLIDSLGLRSWVEWINGISPVSEEQLRSILVQGATAVGSFLAKLLQNIVTDLPGVVFSTFVILLTVFFLLLDGPSAVRFLRENSFFNRRQTERIFKIVVQLCNSVLVASIVSGFVQAVLIGLTCVITGTEGVFLILLVSFIASFLPVIGTAPIMIYLIAQAFIGGEMVNGIIFVVAMGLVGFSDNIVRPYVLKGGAQLHPLVGFVAAFGGLQAIGFYGLFIGPIVTGLFFVLLPVVAKSYVPSRPGPIEDVQLE